MREKLLTKIWVDSFEHQRLSSSKQEEVDAKVEIDIFFGFC